MRGGAKGEWGVLYSTLCHDLCPLWHCVGLLRDKSVFNGRKH